MKLSGRDEVDRLDDRVIQRLDDLNGCGHSVIDLDIERFAWRQPSRGTEDGAHNQFTVGMPPVDRSGDKWLVVAQTDADNVTISLDGDHMSAAAEEQLPGALMSELAHWIPIVSVDVETSPRLDRHTGRVFHREQLDDATRTFADVRYRVGPESDGSGSVDRPCPDRR